ncbi:hypothetical protein C0993_000660 [Termitomyces sp. T159_Od127]|nr:hypothetical protein C0993_000660 [Termitomyces sp. T159_Od127]
MEKAREVEASGKTIAISRRSLALLMHQNKERREGSKAKVESEDEEEANKKAHHLAVAIEASKAVLERDDLAGLSCQPEVAQDIAAQQEGNGQEDKGDEVEATCQAQP